MRNVTAREILADMRALRDGLREDAEGNDDRDIKDLYNKTINDEVWEDLEDLIDQKGLTDKFVPVVAAYKQLGIEWDKFLQSMTPGVNESR